MSINSDVSTPGLYLYMAIGIHNTYPFARRQCDRNGCWSSCNIKCSIGNSINSNSIDRNEDGSNLSMSINSDVSTPGLLPDLTGLLERMREELNWAERDQLKPTVTIAMKGHRRILRFKKVMVRPPSVSGAACISSVHRISTRAVEKTSVSRILGN
jgi:Xaa-Pro aminopeptidase